MKETYLLLCIWTTLTFSPFQLAAQDTDTHESDLVQKALLKAKFKETKTEPDPVFVFSLKKDLPIVIGTSAMAIGGTLLKYSVKPLTESDLATLNPNSVNVIDRRAIGHYRFENAHLSDYLLYVSYLAPFSVLAASSVRQEFTSVLMMYAETASFVAGITGISKGLVKRNRPFTYNPDALLADKLSIGARHSFFSGHVSNSAAFCFFTAYMVNKYAERPGWKTAAWSGAVIIPGTIGYLRYTSGKHFPSDIIAGYIIGAGTGILIPYIHQWKPSEDVSFKVQPLPSGVFMTLTF